MNEAKADPRHKVTWFKLGLTFAALALVILVLANLRLEPDLSHVDVSLLTGNEEGHYYEVGQRLAKRAAAERGTLRVVATTGTLENVKRLVTHAKAPTVQFALAQDGLQWSEDERATLRLVGRLPSPETVFFLAKDADKLTHLKDLAGKRIGIGPEGGGSAQLAQQLFANPSFAPLGLELQHHPFEEQLTLLGSGRVDVVFVVIHHESALIERAVREHKLQVAGFPEARGLAERFPFLRAGVLPAGVFDPVVLVPSTDKPVLQVETLILDDGSASRSDTVAFLQLLSEGYPAFVKHNQELPPTSQSGLRDSPAASDFYKAGGADVLERYAPWLANVVPLSNLLHILMAISVLFNAMGVANRFALWRVDAGRVALEARWATLFPQTTPEELHERDPEAWRARASELHALADEFQALKERCRKLSVSALVPMGQELSYRYQESLINARLAALRTFAERVDASAKPAEAPETGDPT